MVIVVSEQAAVDAQVENVINEGKIMGTLGIVLKGDDKNQQGKPLMKRAMQFWINTADTLLSMIIMKLLLPRTAQMYRVENLYEDSMDDEAAKARFFAFGHVFSGTIATGQRVHIQGPHYIPGSKEDLNVKNIQRTVLMMGHSTEQIADVPCGNAVVLVGSDQCLLKFGTLTTVEGARNIADMKHSVSPVVKVAVKVKDGKEVPKLGDSLKKPSKSDPLVGCTTEESGEHVIAGCCQLHVGICLKDLREEDAQCDSIVSDLVVSYRETVNETSNQTCLAKSPDKHN